MPDSAHNLVKSPADRKPGRASGMRRCVAIVQLVAVVVAVVWLAVNDPAESPSLPQCPTWRWAHIYCPGCGSLRATHRALTGRIQESLRYNAILLPLGAPALLFFAADKSLVATRGRGIRPRRWPRHMGWLIIGVLAAFTVLRNLPPARFDVFRPPERAHGSP